MERFRIHGSYLARALIQTVDVLEPLWLIHVISINPLSRCQNIACIMWMACKVSRFVLVRRFPLSCYHITLKEQHRNTIYPPAGFQAKDTHTLKCPCARLHCVCAVSLWPRQVYSLEELLKLKWEDRRSNSFLKLFIPIASKVTQWNRRLSWQNELIRQSVGLCTLRHFHTLSSSVVQKSSKWHEQILMSSWHKDDREAGECIQEIFYMSSCSILM